MPPIPKAKLEKIVAQIGQALDGKQYAIRGTASVFLQGYDMNVDDIDIIGNKSTVILCNMIFKKYLQDKVSFKESDKFKSYFGKFKMDGVLVEVYGDWQINGKKGWSEVFDASDDEVTTININGVDVKVTKIETELKMFAAMSRWNAYWKLKRQVDNKQEELF